MYHLGLNCYAHDAAACLLKDGRLVALIEEERLSREKHTWKFPRQAIRKCLELEGITIEQIDHFTFFYKPWLEITGNVAHMLRYFPATLNLFKAPSGSQDLTFFSRVKRLFGVGDELRREFGLAKAPHVNFVEHHLCHAANAFFVSGFEEAAILTIDGRGESTATLLARGHGTKIEKLERTKVPHSAGYLYAAFTDHLGFKPFYDEWKVMGMSAYGTDALVSKFRELVRLKPGGLFELNLGYFRFHTHGQAAWLSAKALEMFGPRRGSNDPIDQRHFDIAYALQRVTEDLGVHLALRVHELTGSRALCLSGGVALNVLMNKKIMERTPFERFFIQPVANDAGTGFGSALYHYHHVLGRPREFVFESPYWGPSYSDAEIERAFNARGVSYRRSRGIAAETARHIADGRIVGWFQDRMESGPRALGNRSIVVSAADAAMKDKLNARVKKREFFRPFAPSVLEERAAEYFALPKGQLSPYMILAGDVRAGKRELIPAVTHADNTARVHTVSRKINERYWQLISEYEKISGVPVVLNTSFNENEPIVCTPDDAVNCFLKTEFDVLAIGDFIATK